MLLKFLTMILIANLIADLILDFVKRWQNE